MNVPEPCQTGKNRSTGSDRFIQILLVALTLLGIGLVPIVYSSNTPETQNVVPTEAANMGN